RWISCMRPALHCVVPHGLGVMSAMGVIVFFLKDPATTEIYTLSLPDALPIFAPITANASTRRRSSVSVCSSVCAADRSEEHTSELQSHLNLVCRLLLEKK